MDIHHLDHPDKEYDDDDLVCIGFTSHYDKMRERFGEEFRFFAPSDFEGYRQISGEENVWRILAATATTHGMHINIVFEESNKEKSRFILGELGMPFVKKEQRN